jgi:phosphate:Na+ symporter
MHNVLNLLAAIALLVWGTHTVRSSILKVMGQNLRTVVRNSAEHRLTAVFAGLGVTSLVQSSTATCMIVSSFVGQGLIATGAGLAVMLGADIGTSLMAVVFSFDLSWLSPVLIIAGVALFTSRKDGTAGRIGRILIGLGLITLALQLILAATRPFTQSDFVRQFLASLPNEAMVFLSVGALLTILSYSSLAIVLLTATLAASGILPITAALGLVLGANLGSGLLAVLSTMKAGPAERRVPLGNLIFKFIGCALVSVLIGFAPALLQQISHLLNNPLSIVVLFHLLFNLALSVVMIGFTKLLGKQLDQWLVVPLDTNRGVRPKYLDPTALTTPSLAISCAAREALHQADIIENMLAGLMTVIRTNDLVLSEQLRKTDDTVDALYSQIKFYLTQISRESLSETEGRRWTDIVSFTINMEQVGDVIERILQDVEDKKIRKGRNFSDAGMAEICHLHERLVANLRLGMSVFLAGDVKDAQKLLEEKAHFRELEREYANTHLNRLQDNTPDSIATSSLHIDLISELKRINSHICSIAYPILDQAGALSKTRLRAPFTG